MDPQIAQIVTHFRTTYLVGLPQLIRDETAFLSFVCMMAGIEGLAGFSTLAGGNGERFREFVGTYFSSEYKPLAGNLWNLRNGLAHAFSPRDFLLTHHNPGAHLATFAGVPYLNAEDFFNSFAIAAESYFTALEASEELQTQFLKRVGHAQGGGFFVGEFGVDEVQATGRGMALEEE